MGGAHFTKEHVQAADGHCLPLKCSFSHLSTGKKLASVPTCSFQPAFSRVPAGPQIILRRKFVELTEAAQEFSNISTRLLQNWLHEQRLRAEVGAKQLILVSTVRMGDVMNQHDDDQPERESSRRRRRSRARRAEGGVQLVATSGTTQVAQPSLGRLILEGLTAGGAAGCTVESALYPIDTIKTRLQVARAGGGIQLKGLYSGLSGNLVGVLPASAIFVGVYEPLKQRLLGIFPENFSAGAHLTAGAAGGLAASIVRVPTEVVKQRMQLGQFATAVGAIRGITVAEGVRGLYAGYSAFLLRDLPFDAMQFAIYEQMKLAGKKSFKRDLSDLEVAVIGAVSGGLTGALTTPLDVIKTRLMVQGNSGQYRGVLDCISKTCAEEGAGAMFKGMGPRVLWIGIGGSIFFGVLEKTKQLLAKQRAPPLVVPLAEEDSV